MEEIDPIACMVRARLKTVGLGNFGHFSSGDYDRTWELVRGILREHDRDPELVLREATRVLVARAREKPGLRIYKEVKS